MSLSTSTFTRDGTAYALPPQTTAFTPAASPCATASIYCQFVVGEETGPFSELVCTQGFTTTVDWGVSFDKAQETCFPSNFFKVFEIDADADPQYPKDEDMITAAYPGSACIQDWTTACTADITLSQVFGPSPPSSSSSSSGDDDGGSQATTSRQAWCCAPGYSCTTASAVFSSPTTPILERHCYSYLNSQTHVWASWDPATTGSDGSQYYTYPTSITWDPPKDKYTVYHKPLPLAISAWVGREGGTEGETVVTGTADAAGAGLTKLDG